MFLQTQDLILTYPENSAPVVNGVTLGLNQGDIGVLIGPSGSGKTTLLRAIAGLHQVTGGTIFLEGTVVSSSGFHQRAEERRVGMVFQDYALFPHLNVADNISFGMHRWPTQERKMRIQEVLHLVGLTELEHRYPHELSGGQQQRIALARSLALRPALLLLDEPFSNLDVEMRARIAEEIRAILKSTGTTALFVTHDQMEAFAIGDVIGVMDQGRLLQWGNAYELYHQPVSRTVAQFIGHGVFLPATVCDHDGQSMVQSTLGSIVSKEKLAQGRCDILIRADDVIHDDASPTQAKILRKSFRGSEFLYTLELQGGETVLAHVPSHHDHAVGEFIGIRPEMEHVVIFK